VIRLLPRTRGRRVGAGLGAAVLILGASLGLWFASRSADEGAAHDAVAEVAGADAGPGLTLRRGAAPTRGATSAATVAPLEGATSPGPGPLVTGQVREAGGHGVAEGVVLVFDSRSEPLERAQVEPDSTFKLMRPGALGRHQVVYVGKEQATPPLQIDLRRGQHLLLHAQSLVLIEVLVLDQQGAPVPDALVHGNLCRDLDQRARTDASGRARVQVHPADRVSLTAAAGDRSGYAELWDVQDAPVEPVRIELTRALPRVRVRAVAAPGASSLEGKTVVLRSGFSPHVELESITATIGGPAVPLRIHVLDLPHIAYTGPVSVHLPGEEPWSFRIPPAQLRSMESDAICTVEVALSACQIELTLVDPGGNPIRFHDVQLKPADGRGERTHIFRAPSPGGRTDEDGVVRIRCPPGTYHTPGGDLEVRGDVKLRATLSMSTCWGHAHPPVGYVAIFDGAGPEELARTRVESGRWAVTVGAAPSTTLRAVLLDPGTKEPLAEAPVIAGGEAAELRMEGVLAGPDAGTVRVQRRGRLVPVEVFAVSVSGSNPRVFRALGSTGECDLAGLPAGTYTFQVQRMRSGQSETLTFGPYELAGLGETIVLELD